MQTTGEGLDICFAAYPTSPTPHKQLTSETFTRGRVFWETNHKITEQRYVKTFLDFQFVKHYEEYLHGRSKRRILFPYYF